jgi:hypothetical protein
MKHGARSWVCSTVSSLLGLVGFAKGENYPTVCRMALRWSVSSADEAGLTLPYQLCLRQGPKVRKEESSVRRLIFFAFELFRNAFTNA